MRPFLASARIAPIYRINSIISITALLRFVAKNAKTRTYDISQCFRIPLPIPCRTPAAQPKFHCPQFDGNSLKPRTPNDFLTMGGSIDGKKRVFPCREGNPTGIASCPKPVLDTVGGGAMTTHAGCPGVGGKRFE